MGEEITEDLIYGGRLRIRQPARGYRVNVDTILLAATLPLHRARGRVVEPGCGVGGALLAVAKLNEIDADNRYVGIERDPRLASLARENAISNGLSACVEIIEGDALAPPSELGQFDHVLFNPPYDYVGEGRAPSPERQGSYISDRPTGDWIKVWSNRMTSFSNLTLIQRPHRLSEILAALEGRLGGVEIYPIRPSASSKARRIIVRAWKGSRAPLKLFHGLDLHPDDESKDKYTPEAEAILRGEQGFALG